MLTEVRIDLIGKRYLSPDSKDLGVKHEDILRKIIPRKGHSQQKGSLVGMCLTCSRNNKVINEA